MSTKTATVTGVDVHSYLDADNGPQTATRGDVITVTDAELKRGLAKGYLTEGDVSGAMPSVASLTDDVLQDMHPIALRAYAADHPEDVQHIIELGLLPKLKGTLADDITDVTEPVVVKGKGAPKSE